MAKKLSAFLTACALMPATVLMAADKKKDANEPARETVAKPMSEKEKRKREEKLRKELEGPYRKWLNEDVAYIITDEERHSLQAPRHRRRTRAVHRAVLAAPRSHARHRGERIQGRALPPHRLRQRALRLRHSRLEDGPRPHLHHLRPAGRKRIASLRRHLRAADRRRRRHHVDLPVREMALPLDRGHRQRHHHRVRRPDDDRRVPHDDGSVRKGRAAVWFPTPV